MASLKTTKDSVAKTAKKIISPKEKQLNNQDIAKEKLEKITNEVIAKSKELKDKFNKADNNTKRKIIAGLSALAAGLLTISSIKKHAKKRKEEKKSEEK